MYRRSPEPGYPKVIVEDVIDEEPNRVFKVFTNNLECKSEPSNVILRLVPSSDTR
jgi:hypothetical protein